MHQFIQWLKMAARNIIKSRRRSVVKLIAIGFGFASISLFQGYIHSIYDGLRASAIHGSGVGHLTVYKKGWQLHGKSDPKAYMLTPQDLKTIEKISKQHPYVKLASPRLSVSGLVSNGINSTIFIAQGVVPEHETTIKGEFYDFQPVKGQPLSSDQPFSVEMSQGLSDQLSLLPATDGVIMGATLDGQMNAMDIQIAGTYNTGLAETNDKFIKLPFLFAQSFVDTQKADSVVLLLDHWQHTQNVKADLMDQLKAAGADVEIKKHGRSCPFSIKVSEICLT